MKILFVLHRTSINDGSTKAFLSFLNEIGQKDVEAHVALPDHKGIYAKLKEMGIPTVVSAYRPNTYPHCNTIREKILFIPRFIARRTTSFLATRKITRYAKQNEIDLIHTNVGVAAVGFFAAQKLGLPHIYHIREYRDRIGLNYYPTSAVFTKQLNSKNSYAICITKDIRKHYGLEESCNAIVIYDGVCPKAKMLPKPISRDYFLYAGRIEPIKGLDRLVMSYHDYLRQMPDNSTPVPLYIAGATPRPSESYLSKIKQYVADNKMSEMVKFLGERKDISQLMTNARAIIIPSLTEGFGFCMPEAMFVGCLAIAYDVAGTKEQLDNGLQMTSKEIALRYINGQQLTNHILAVTTQAPSYYDDYRQRAFDVVNSLYTSQQSAKRIYDFYCGILNQTK